MITLCVNSNIKKLYIAWPKHLSIYHLSDDFDIITQIYVQTSHYKIISVTPLNRR